EHREERLATDDEPRTTGPATNHERPRPTTNNARPTTLNRKQASTLGSCPQTAHSGARQKCPDHGRRLRARAGARSRPPAALSIRFPRLTVTCRPCRFTGVLSLSMARNTRTLT